jgi:hypothetical protein
MDRIRPSTVPTRVAGRGRLTTVDETHFAEIDAAMLCIEEARARADSAWR